MRRFASVTSKIKEPDQIAEWVTEQLVHSVSLKQEGSSTAAQYDLTGHVMQRATLFQTRVPEKQIEKLLDLGKYMHLDRLAIDDFDTLVIARICRFINPGISLLDLNSNPEIKDAGASHLVRHVISHTPLKSLFLSSCGLTSTGLVDLAASLTKNKDMQILELRKNQITDEGAEALAEALIANMHPRPISVFLSGNLVTDSGALSLAKASIYRDDLKVWLMDSPGISSEAKEEISRFTKNLRF